MWSWFGLALAVYHIIRWPLDLWWIVWVISWLQASVLITLLPCYQVHPQGRWIFKTMLSFASVFSMGLWIKESDIYSVGIVTVIAIIYGAASYHNLMELRSPLQRRTLAIRAWPIWNVLHRYYRLEVWRERRHRVSSRSDSTNTLELSKSNDTEPPTYDSIDVLFRLWMVSCKIDDYYRRWPSQSKVLTYERSSKPILPSLWIAHPHGSGSTSILLAFAFQGTCVDTTAYGPIVVALDDGYFAVPVMREVLIWLGCISSQKDCIRKALLEGNSVVVAPGLYAESLNATFSRFSINTEYTTELLELGREYNSPIRPLVVLGENESISGFRWWDAFRSWIWTKWSVRLPGITWPFWTPQRRLVVGRPIENNPKLESLFYQRWLTLFDESRCALRRIESYYTNEGDENDTMALLRAKCNRPLQPRIKKILYRPSPMVTIASDELIV